MMGVNIRRSFIVTLLALAFVVFYSSIMTIDAGNTSSGSGWNSWKHDDDSSSGSKKWHEKGHGSSDDDSCSDDKSSGHKPKKKPSKNWLTKGNKNIDPEKHFLGTTDEADLVIKTNNTEKMRVTTEGDVGIGTDTPTGTLHVEGGVATDDTQGKDITIDAQDGGPDGGAGGNILLLPGESGDGFAPEGYVGIGTDTPTLTLDINGQIRIRGGSPFIGAVLTSDSFGNASWMSINVNDDDSDPTNELNTGFSFDGTTLTVTDAGGDQTANISSLLGTDDQSLSGATLIGTTLEVTIEDGTPASVDLVGLQDGTGTDDQNLSGATWKSL